MPPAGFEPTVLGIERPQTHALDRVATGIGPLKHTFVSCRMLLHTHTHTHTHTYRMIQKGGLNEPVPVVGGMA